VGTKRATEELSALVGTPALEVSGPATADLAAARLLVGTEAVLHRVRGASLVVFLDFDQELLAPRYRAGAQALALLARAARLVGGRAGGWVAVQTRLPDHEVLAAALHADPGIYAAAEEPRRRALRLPPYSALAVASGEDLADYAAAVDGVGGIERAALDGDRMLLRAPDAARLADALAAAGAPRPGVRIEVDPLRV
jgi:primosomal protein N' (replication factor Y)